MMSMVGHPFSPPVWRTVGAVLLAGPICAFLMSLCFFSVITVVEMIEVGGITELRDGLFSLVLFTTIQAMIVGAIAGPVLALVLIAVARGLRRTSAAAFRGLIALGLAAPALAYLVMKGYFPSLWIAVPVVCFAVAGEYASRLLAWSQSARPN